MLKNRFTNWVGLLAVTGAPLLSVACVSGAVGGEPPTRAQGAAGNGASPSAGGGGTSGAVGGVAPPVPTSLPEESTDCTTGSPGPRLLRRLTAREFAASIADLFGDHSAPVAQVFNDSRVLGFSVDSSTLLVQDLNADQLMNNAEAVASWAVSSKLSQLTQLATCSSPDQSCAKAFVKNFGRKAFRTNIPDNDPRITTYSDLFVAEAKAVTDASPAGSPSAAFAAGASAVIAAMLQSPYFIYRSEIGDGATNPTDPSTINLTPYEVASSLSYLLTGSTPDDTLLKAADAVGNDSTALRKMVDDQAARLLGPSGSDPLSPAAQDALMNFMSGWLGLDRLYTNVKDDKMQMLTDAQRADMANQTKQFILGIWGGSTNNTVSDLFTKVMQSSDHDGGILAQASILIGYARADVSSPTQRGHLVRSRLLCQDVPPPPPGLDTKFTPDPNLKTTREKYLQGHAAPGREPCYTCHTLMDPIGVAFEHYDAFGNYRTVENNEPIDATGVIHGAPGGDVNIDGLSGPQGLETYLAKSDAVKNCLVRYWSYYAFGTASWAQDKCTYDAIRKAAASDSYSLKSVLTAILRTPRFTTRVKDN